MSKRHLKKYLEDLSKPELEDQILELHDRLKEVKQFYAFVFNPNEEKMMEEAKMKISLEYFPVGKRKKAKKRRSVAQKQIKEFIKLGVDPLRIADLMLYNLEVAIAYNEESPMKQAAFYRSMLKSFQDMVKFVDDNALKDHFMTRIEKIVDTVYLQQWINKSAFEDVMSKQ
ncbi:MAG: DUF6155 family protein [Crocinitomicaceae bacterium]